MFETMKLLELKNRFMRDSSSVRLGSIASDLFRLSSLAQASNKPVFNGVLTEVKLFTEWAAPEMDLSKQKVFLSLQRQMTDWDLSKGRYETIQRDSKRWSRTLLNISGLLKKGKA